MPQLYVVGFVAGSLSVVFDLSWNTVFVSVTQRERYVEAMSLLNGSRSLAYVAGPTIGGLLVQVLGAPLAMLADALSFLGSVVFLRRIRSPEPPIEPRPSRSAGGSSAGLAFVLRDPIIRPSMLAVATVNLFNFSFGALFILYVTSIWRVAGRARAGPRRRRGRRPDRGGHRVADRPADRARTGLRAGLLHLPGVADPRPGRRAGHADAGHPGLILAPSSGPASG